MLYCVFCWLLITVTAKLVTCPCWCQSIYFYFFCLSCFFIVTFIIKLLHGLPAWWAVGLSGSPLLCLLTIFALLIFCSMHYDSSSCGIPYGRSQATRCSGRELDSWSRGRGFDSDRGIIRATTLGKLFTPNVPLFTKQYNLVPCEGLHAISAVLLAAA